MSPQNNDALSIVYLLLGVGGVLGATSSGLMVLFIGLPTPILVCATIQACLGAYMLYRFFQRSRKKLTMSTLLIILVCFLINGVFAAYLIFRLAEFQ